MTEHTAASGKAARVTLKGLTKSFGPKSVLHGIDLDIAPGSFLSIVGRSGCGKSTLLRIILGLETKTSGTLDISVGDASHGGARLVFQEPRLLPWQTVAANVAVGLGTQADGPEAEARVHAALASVGLGDRGAEWPSVLSGGQRQRVALARALVSRPTMLALDEPLGALDALTRIDMQALIENVWTEQGFTAILVTHDVTEAVALGDRVIVIEDGGIALDVPVPIERPRRRGDPELAAIEGIVLEHLMARS